MVSKMEHSKKQKRSRRSFTDEFKAGAVRLVLDEGKTVAQVARDLDLTQSAVGGWVKQERAERTGGKTGLTAVEREELARLRKENRSLRMERDLLKKAAVRSTGHCNTMSPGGWQRGTVVHEQTRAIKRGTARAVATVEGR